MLEARSLTKFYDHTAAVRGVSFSIHPGEILGYLGPNGAGKSTTVKMLTGLIDPSQGQIFYQGRTVHDDFTAFQRRIGYVPEEAHLYPHLTGREYLQLTGRLRTMPRRAPEPKMDEFLRAFGLWDDRHAPLSSYSKGMRQKILLSAALLHDPEILIQPHFSHRFVARGVRRPRMQGARRSARGSVLGQYVEHGERAQRSRRGLIARRSRKGVRNAG